MAPEQTRRGEERRSALIEAGVGQLAEAGWAGVTHRAVAARAGANPGLVHYYFGGSPGLRLAVAERACSATIGAMVDELVSVQDEPALLTAIGQALETARDDERQARLVTEMVSAAFNDPRIGAVVRAEFARARTALEQWFRRRHPDRSPAQAQTAATLLLALADGLTIHLLLDRALTTEGITQALLAIGKHTADPTDGQGR